MSVTYENNEPTNAIIDSTRHARSNLHDMRDSLQVEYWTHHKLVSEAKFSCISDQVVALRKLGQLADLLGAVDEAYRAATMVSCWLD